LHIAYRTVNGRVLSGACSTPSRDRGQLRAEDRYKVSGWAKFAGKVIVWGGKNLIWDGTKYIVKGLASGGE
jgi:hypothetical protein